MTLTTTTRRLFAQGMLVLLLCSLCACGNAESSTEGWLYPACKEGLWGYIDRKGAWQIQPQWRRAGDFSDGTAIVSAEEENDFSCGLIDAQGLYILAPDYLICRERELCIVCQKTENGVLYGYYDLVSGLFVPPQYDAITWKDSDADSEKILAVQNGLIGFIDRKTGKESIPFQYVPVQGTSEFRSHHAIVGELQEGGVAPILIDEQGRKVELSQEYEVYSTLFHGISEGFVGLKNRKTGQYGYLRLDDKTVIKPQFDAITNFSQGYAAVAKEIDGQLLWEHIDQAGTMLCQPRYSLDTAEGDEPSGYAFSSGIALLDDGDTWKAIDSSGEIVFPISQNEEMFDSKRYILDSLMSNDRLWYMETESHSYLYGLMDKQGIALSAPAWRIDDAYFETDAYMQNAFPEGKKAVSKDGRWGFINQDGATVLPFLWEDATDFYHGLARVKSTGKMAYINSEGQIIWQEDEGERVHPVQ